MRVYQCDSCNKVIQDPYIVKMKKFYVEIDMEYFTRIKTPIKRKRKMCDECYKGLNLIGETVPKSRKRGRTKTMVEKEYIERELLNEGIELAENRLEKKKSVFHADIMLDTLRVFKKFVSEIPTADVQEVVRCKDCIFGKYDDDLNMILCKRIYNLSDGEYVYNDLNDFCSYGEKKRGNGNG